MTNKKVEKRLKELKKAIENENISYGEIAELQSLRKYIKDDVVLEEWAGIPEEDILTDMFGEGGKEEVEEYYTNDINETKKK